MKTKTITVISSEEFKDQTSLFLSNGHEVSFPTSRLIDYIEANHLNVHTEGTGLTSDPNGTEVEVSIDADIFLDENWESITRSYYQNVILKGE